MGSLQMELPSPVLAVGLQADDLPIQPHLENGGDNRTPLLQSL